MLNPQSRPVSPGLNVSGPESTGEQTTSADHAQASSPGASQTAATKSVVDGEAGAVLSHGVNSDNVNDEELSMGGAQVREEIRSGEHLLTSLDGRS